MTATASSQHDRFERAVDGLFHGRCPGCPIGQQYRERVQLVTRDATAPEDSDVSVFVGSDIEVAHEEAKRRGFEIVHQLTTEPWGLRRFFVRAPDGNVINMTNHSDEYE